MSSDPIAALGGSSPAVVSPARTSPVSHTQRVYRELGRLIIAGDIAPGAKLKIGELCERLSAGATPVREALSLLTSDQLVERIDQRGFRAAPVSQAHFREILGLRCQLEEIALRASLAVGDDDWSGRLAEAHEALAAIDRAERERWEAAHRTLHRTLIDACESPILLRFCDQLYDLNIRYRNLAARASSLGARDVATEHRRIVDASLARDADAACRTLREHYTRTGDYLAGQLGDIA